MRLYTCIFQGYWPVGAIAIVFARTHRQAEDLMRVKIEEMNLSRKNEKIELKLMVRDVRGVERGVKVLLDGGY